MELRANLYSVFVLTRQAVTVSAYLLGDEVTG